MTTGFCKIAGRSIIREQWPVFVLVTGVCSLFAQSKPPALILVFAFNHEEAARSFRRASELDPQSAMPFWGLALALGPCINLDVDPPHEQAAYEAVQKALARAPGATESEQAYIQALAKRYSSEPKVDLRKLDAEYANAMRE